MTRYRGMVPLFELVCILAAIARYSLIYPAISYFLSPIAKLLSPLFKTMLRSKRDWSKISALVRLAGDPKLSVTYEERGIPKWNHTWQKR